MVVFNTDLDNTMIFSYKHDIGKEKRNVEIYEGREISFITEKTFHLIQRVKEKVLFVPTTTRTVEQYERIDLGIGTPKYALTCNGGVLLIDGTEDERWYQESKDLVLDAVEEMKMAITMLEQDLRRTLDVRFIKELFVFTKCEEPENVVKELRQKLDTALVDVFNTGVKVYVIPKNLSKGKALKRFRKYVKADCVIAAGDSEFDISMFDEADLAIAPWKLADRFEVSAKTVRMPEKKVFSEEVLEYVLEYCERRKLCI